MVYYTVICSTVVAQFVCTTHTYIYYRGTWTEKLFGDTLDVEAAYKYVEEAVEGGPQPPIVARGGEGVNAP